MKKLILPIVVLALALAACTKNDVPDEEEVKKKAGEPIEGAETPNQEPKTKKVVTVHAEDEMMNVTDPTVTDVKHHFWSLSGGASAFLVDENRFYLFDIRYGIEVMSDESFKQVKSNSDQTESADGKAFFTEAGNYFEVVNIEDDTLSLQDQFQGKRIKGNDAEKYQKFLDGYRAKKKAQD